MDIPSIHFSCMQNIEVCQRDRRQSIRINLRSLESVEELWTIAKQEMKLEPEYIKYQDQVSDDFMAISKSRTEVAELIQHAKSIHIYDSDYLKPEYFLDLNKSS